MPGVISACGWMRTGLTAIRSVLPMIPSHTTQARQTHKMMMKGSKQTRLTLTQFRLQSKAAQKKPKRGLMQMTEKELDFRDTPPKKTTY